MRPLEQLTAVELGRAVNEGELDPVEVIEYFISRIERLNPDINAFTYTRFDYAREQAKLLKDRLSHGEKCGPFAGVPFGLKDFLPSKTGWTASHGGVPSRMTIDEVDSEFTKAMEKAGGIAIGKTNAPAYGFSALCDNKLYGPSHNPFDLSRNTGGSSGGSAASVASGMALVCEGGDAGGSIRIPAAWNNLFGFKATAGAIPSVIRPDSFAATHPYCCNGGLTKSVEDMAILLNNMVRFDPRDPISVPFPHEDFLDEMRRDLHGKKIGFTLDFGLFPIEKEMRDHLVNVVEFLRDKGLCIEDVDFRFEHTAEELMDMWAYGLSFDSVIEFETLKKQGMDFLKDHRDEIPEAFALYCEKTAQGGVKDFYAFNLIRTEILDAFEDAFSKYDLILSPVSLCMPPLNGKEKGSTLGPNEIDGKPIDPAFGFATTFLVNFIGYPAASVPVGLSKERLPMGMHVIGPRFQDGLVLAFAKKVEEWMPWREHYALSYH